MAAHLSVDLDLSLTPIVHDNPPGKRFLKPELDWMDKSDHVAELVIPRPRDGAVIFDLDPDGHAGWRLAHFGVSHSLAGLSILARSKQDIDR
jgi:hypothetical protein